MRLLAVNMMGTVFWIVLAVFAAGLFVYGVLRRLSRMSWGAAEVLAVFGISQSFALIPFPSALAEYLSLIFLLLAASAAVLVASGSVRNAVRTRNKKTTKGKTAADRVLGGLYGAGEGALICFVLFGAVLTFTEAFTDAPPAFLQEGISSAVYGKAGKYALDVLLVFLLVYSLKGGFRLGFGKYLWVGVTLSMSFFSVFGALLLVLDVPAFAAFAGKIAGTMGYLHPFIARTVGVFVAAFLVFLLFFAVIVAISVLVNKLFTKVNRVRSVNILSGTLQAAIIYFITVAILTGIGVGLDALIRAASAQETLAPAAVYLEKFLAAVCRSPLAAVFHNSNPLAPLLP